MSFCPGGISIGSPLHGVWRGTLLLVALLLPFVTAADEAVDTSPALTAAEIPLRLGPDSVHAGNLYRIETDIDLPSSLEVGLYLQRSYNSRSDRAGVFGPGWTADPLDIRLLRRPDGAWVLLEADGREEEYTPADEDLWLPLPAEGLRGVRLYSVSEGFLLLRDDGERWIFDSAGRLAAMVDPSGNRLSIRRAVDGVTPGYIEGPFGRRITLRTANGRVTAAEGPGGLRCLFSYDEAGRLASSTDPLGRQTVYRYGAAGLLISVERGGGDREQYAHAGGLLARLTPAGGPDYTLRYRPLREGEPGDYRVEVSDPAGRVVRGAEIRASGRERSEIDELGLRTVMRYDPSWRLVARRGPAGRTERFHYGTEGALSAYDDPLGNRTEYEWEAPGETLVIRGPRGGQTTLHFDPLGRVRQAIDTVGVVTEYRRDGLGRVVEVLEDGRSISRTSFGPEGALSRVEVPGAQWTVGTDPLGRLTRVVDGEGRETTTTLDLLGRPLTHEDGAGGRTHWSYDEHGRLVSVTDGAGGQVRFGYDASGRLRSVEDGNGHRYELSAGPGPDRSLTLPNGTIVARRFDLDSRTLVESEGGEQPVVYKLDEKGRIASQTYEGGWTTWSHDELGRVVEAAGEGGTYRMTYDRFGDLQTVQDPHGKTIRYLYDEHGRRSGLVYPNGLTARYEYDELGQLARIVGPKEETYGYSRDAAGRLVRREQPGGVVTNLTYDRGGLLSEMKTTDGKGRPVLALGITRDGAGRISRVEEGDSVWSYAYDPAGRLALARGPGGYEEGFTYDAAGNRLTRERGGGGERRSRYGQLNELLSDGRLDYSYDAQGRLTRRSDGTRYRYDGLGRLASVRNAEGQVVRYHYDPFGRLVRRKVDEGPVVDYLYDAEDILVEYERGEEGRKTRWVHGPGLDDPLARLRKGQSRFLIPGLNGDLRRVLDEKGKVVASLDYGAFGRLLNPEEVPGGILTRFLARPWDPVSGLHHLRARFYDSRNGRFLRPDPLFLRGGWNLYAYGGGDPVNHADPMGLEPRMTKGLSLGGQVSLGEFFGWRIPTPGVKFGLNLQHFGPGDPRNGLYTYGGLTFGTGSTIGLSSNVAVDDSGNPTTPWQGGTSSLEYTEIPSRLPRMLRPPPSKFGLGPKSGGAVFWSARRPWDPDPRGWKGVETNLISIGTRPRNPRNRIGAFAAQTFSKQVWQWNKNFQAIEQKVRPPRVMLAIGESQVFTFLVVLTKPDGKGSATPFDATTFAKWRYISWDSTSHTSIPCNGPTRCNENVFTCTEKGSFSILANYYNPYVTDPRIAKSSSGGSAEIECVEGGGEEKPQGAKDEVRFERSRHRVREDQTTATLMVQRIGKGKGKVSVQYRTYDLTAVAPDDYDATSGVLAWGDGDLAAKPVSVFVKDDKKAEPEEDLTVSLHTPDGHVVIGKPGVALVTIEDVKQAAIELTMGTATGATIFNLGSAVDLAYRVSIPQPPGNVPLSGVLINDSQCPSVTLRSGDANGNGKLDLGESWEYACTWTPTAEGKVTHTARAWGTGPSGQGVSDTATLTIEIKKGKVKVPDVRGYPLSAAEYDLREAKLTTSHPVHYGKSDAPVGEVYDQKPVPGTEVDVGHAVELWVSQDEPRRIFLDPPRSTIPLDQEVVFRAFLVTKDQESTELDPRTVTWSPGPGNVFRGTEAGAFTVTAESRGVSGFATVTVEEEEKTEWDSPISHADELTKRALPPPPDAFTWYALCNRQSGDVVYGETTDPTQFQVLAGPFQGPRDTRLWIDTNYPSWRCTAGRKGDWNVLCDREAGAVRLGTGADPTRYTVLAGDFPGEPEARAWVSANCPGWICESGGGCATAPRRGGDWAVVCSKSHGGVGLSRKPDPTRQWIFAEGLLSEKDARLWTNLRCPSWRCNEWGTCLPGQYRPRERPLELPPELGGSSGGGGNEGRGDTGAGETGGASEGGDLRSGDSGGGSGGGTATDEPSWDSDAPDCSALRDSFQKKSDDLVNRARELNCKKGNHYSGCALDVVGPFFPYWPARIFSDEACRNPAAVQCMSGAYSGYLGCLDGCNGSWRGSGQPLRPCLDKCQKQMDQATKGCAGK